MAGLPRMDFYPADWLLGTMAMSAEARGAYIDLLCHAWDQGGSVPSDEAVLGRLARVDVETWTRVRGEVLAKFVETNDGRLRHRRVDAEIRRAKQRSKTASENALKRHRGDANSCKGLNDKGEVASNPQCQNHAIYQLPTNTDSVQPVTQAGREAASDSVPADPATAIRDELWVEGMRIAQAQGLTKPQARGLIAKAVQHAGGEALIVLDLLHVAEQRPPEALSPWLIGAVKHRVRGNGHARSTTQRPSAIQDFWRRHGRSSGPSGDGPDASDASDPSPSRG